MATRDPNSETAKTAVPDLRTQADNAADTTRLHQSQGTLPAFRHTGKNQYTVLDSRTGSILAERLSRNDAATFAAKQQTANQPATTTTDSSATTATETQEQPEGSTEVIEENNGQETDQPSLKSESLTEAQESDNDAEQNETITPESAVDLLLEENGMEFLEQEQTKIPLQEKIKQLREFFASILGPVQPAVNEDGTPATREVKPPNGLQVIRQRFARELIESPRCNFLGETLGSNGKSFEEDFIPKPRPFVIPISKPSASSPFVKIQMAPTKS